MGKFGTGERNDGKEMRIDSVEMYCMINYGHLFLLRRMERKCTWRSPNGETKTEIVFIIAEKSRNITNVAVTNRVLKTGCDQIMVAN